MSFFAQTMDDNSSNLSIIEHPELRLVWPALIMGFICSILGAFFHYDFGSVVGAIIGVVIGAILAECYDEENEDKALDLLDPDIQLATHQEGLSFFGAFLNPNIEEQGIRLPTLKNESIKSNDRHLEQEYTLRLFEQATTSRKTGVFPHQQKKNS